MATSLSRTAGYICRTCRSQSRIQLQRSSFVSSIPAAGGPTRRSSTLQDRSQARAAAKRTQSDGRNSSLHSAPRKASRPGHSPSPVPSNELSTPKSTATLDTSDAPELLRKLRNEINAIAISDEVPDQARVLEALEKAYNFANLIIFGQTVSPEEAAEDAQDRKDNIPLLSDLEEEVRGEGAKLANKQINLPVKYREKAAADICNLIYGLLKDPKVALDENVLSIYVRTICQLGHPEYLPEIFFLYANKPIPLANTKPVQYGIPSPSAAKNAIPQQLSDVALDTAILQRDLPLAIAIIDTTVATSAFRRNKFLRKGSIPLAAAGSTPLVAWAGAEWLAQWQDTFDPAMSKYMTMMGAMAYIGTLGTVGFIALTTWNDHHDRVVWTPGTPLRQRWSREEERLYFDRIAVAWGFQRRQRRGEEMGEEWEALREIVGERSMILDKSDLLEGMQ